MSSGRIRRAIQWLWRLLVFPLHLRPLEIACLLAALIAVPHFWSEADLERGDPQLLSMARMELPYFGALSQVARELPPAAPPEVAAEHGRAYPRWPLWLHAAAWRYGGPWGLMAADLLTTAAAYCLFAAIFRLLLRSRAAALLAAAALVNGTAPALLGVLRVGCVQIYFALMPVSKALVVLLPIGAALWAIWAWRRDGTIGRKTRALVALSLATWIALLEFEPGYWQLRFPRPFVTGLAANLWLLALLMAWRRPRLLLPSVLTGFAAGLTLVADPYSFGALGLTTMGLWLARRRFHFWQVMALIIPLLAVSAPSLWRQWQLPPEMRLRMGFTPLPRAHLFALAGEVTGPALPFCLALAACLVAARILSATSARSTVWVPLWALFGMAASPFILVGVAGAAVQFWHYQYLLPASCTFFAWVIGSAGVAPLVPRMPSRLWPVASCLLALGCGVWGALLPRNQNVFGGETPFSRSAFVTLAQELRGPAYAECKVLGTWRPEVRAWWQAYRGPVLNPDPFSSALPASELERRCVRLAQLHAYTHEEFEEWLRLAGQRATAFWQFGHFKYHVDHWYTFAPRTDYERYAENEHLLPDSTISRLLAAFETPAIPYPCDLIVRDASPSSTPPPGYELTFRNPRYEVWRALPAAPVR